MATEAETTPVAKRPRGRPLGSVKKAVIPENDATTFNMSVWVEIPKDPIVIRSSSRKRPDKVEKQEPWLLGPVTLHQDMTYEQLLATIAETVESDVDLLVKPSLNWRWHKNSPGKGPTMPLTNDQGFQIMVQQIRTAKKGPAGIITINMSAPRKKQKQVSILVRVSFASRHIVQLIIVLAMVIYIK